MNAWAITKDGEPLNAEQCYDKKSTALWYRKVMPWGKGTKVQRVLITVLTCDHPAPCDGRCKIQVKE